MLRKMTIALLVLFSFLSDAGSASVEKVTYEQIKGRAAMQQAYTINDEVQIALPIGKSVQFEVTDNDYGLKEYCVYPGSDDLIWICYLDTDGNVIDTRATDFRRINGSLQQVSATECLAIMKWKVEGDMLQLQFCISTDKQKNWSVREETKSKKVRMAVGGNNSKPYPPPTISETRRLAGFVRLWSEVKYNFVFFDRVPELDWDQVLVEYIPKVQEAKTVEEYYRVLLQCMALLRDGHTDVSGPGTSLIKELSRLPIELWPLTGGKAVIVAITPMERLRNPALIKELEEANLKLYEEVTHIDGRPIQQILEEEIYPWICQSTPHVRDLKAFRQLVRGPYHSKATLRIRGLDGEQREVTLTRSYFPMEQERVLQGFVCRELENGIVYVNLPSFESDSVVRDFDAIFPQVQKAKGLILDVRHNGGGSTGNGDAIISMLTKEKIEGSRWRTRKYLPAFRAWGQKEGWYEGEHDLIQPSKTKPYLGPIVVLTGPNTASAAEDFVVALHASKRATIVGERTAGTTGQPLYIDLPEGGTARICTKWNTYPDGREFVGIGVIPDVELHPTQESLASHTDVALQKGIEVLRAKL